MVSLLLAPESRTGALNTIIGIDYIIESSDIRKIKIRSR